MLSCGETLVWRSERGAPAVPFIECARHIPYVLEVSGSLDVAALSAAVDALAARHPMLRASYDAEGGRLIRPPAAGLLRHVDLIDVGQGGRTAIAHDVVRDEVNAPFDLTTGVCRALLVRADRDRHLLALTVHHIVFDAWSRQVVARDLHGLYGAASGAAAPPPLAASYQEYVAFERTNLDGPALDSDREFWLRRFDGLADVRIAPDVAAPAGDSPTAGRRSFTIDRESAERLRAAGRRHGATLAVTTLAVFALVIHEMTDVNDVAIGIPMADRPRRRFEGVVGLMMNALTLRSERPDRGFGALVRATAREFSNAYDHRQLPFAHLVDLLRRHGAGAGVPFRVLLNFVKEAPAGVGLPGLESATVAVVVDSPSAADLSLHVLDARDGLRGVLVYRRDRFSAHRAAECVERFEGAVRRVLAQPD